MATLQQRYDAVQGGVADQDAHIELVRALAVSRRFLPAFHVLNLACERFGDGDQQLDAVASVFAALEESGGMEGIARELPPGVAAALSEEIDRSLKNHGPGSRRPAGREFVCCVALKNLVSRLPAHWPGRMSLLRICDCYGRVSAERGWGVPIRGATVQDGLARLSFGDQDFRYRIAAHEVWKWRLYFMLQPGLVRWLAGFRRDAVFLDIGANVGRYSILAAMAGGYRTVAVEPFSVNYEILRANVDLNGLADRLTTLRAAIHDETGEGLLSYSKVEAGAADQHFAVETDQTVYGRSERTEGYRLDDLVATGAIPFPEHIKIDVDGGESRLIDGMAETLADRRLKSIRLEIRLDDEANCSAMARLAAAGFDCAVDDDEKNYLCLRR
jgi:FkbM family methyltransferase